MSRDAVEDLPEQWCVLKESLDDELKEFYLEETRDFGTESAALTYLLKELKRYRETREPELESEVESLRGELDRLRDREEDYLEAIRSLSSSE